MSSLMEYNDLSDFGFSRYLFYSTGSVLSRSFGSWDILDVRVFTD